MKYIRINKQDYELSKLSLGEFVLLGGGSEADYYKLSGKEKPVVKELTSAQKRKLAKELKEKATK